MSWHCLICGEAGEPSVTGLMYIFDIRGGIPIKACVHIGCLANVCNNWGAEDLAHELDELDKENSGD